MWQHFVKVTRNDNEISICNYCKVNLKAPSGNGTTTLHNLYARCNARQTPNIVDCFKKQKQTVIDRKRDGKIQYASFDQEVSRRELAVAIITHEYPLSMAEHEKFRSFITSLQSYFKTPCRNTVKKDIMKIYESEYDKFYKILENLKSRIAITTDMWTSNQKKRLHGNHLSFLLMILGYCVVIF
ncbi:hypothetical protein M5689_003957 [Euphorbia peplus]|nr:hypothetical protein M5689_003957 [Euphorbia peplus]